MSQEFIYYAYTFYTNLFEENNLAAFRSGWVDSESLGDIARYNVAVTGMVEKRDPTKLGTLPVHLVTSAALATSHFTPTPACNTPDASAVMDQNVSSTPAGSPMCMARIDDSSSIGPEFPHQDARIMQQGIPNVGVTAVRLMVLEPDKDRRCQALQD